MWQASSPSTTRPRRRRRRRVVAGLSLGIASAGCGHRSQPALTPRNAQATDAVLVDFRAGSDEQWTLRRKDGAHLCTLPCSYWVLPSDDLALRHESGLAASGERTTFDVPAAKELPAGAGERVSVVVDREHAGGNLGKVSAAGLGVLFGLMGTAFLGIGIASLATGSKDTKTTVEGGVSASSEGGGSASTSAESTTDGTAASVTGIVVGASVSAVAGLCWYWFVHARSGGIRTERRPAGGAARAMWTPAPAGFTLSF